MGQATQKRVSQVNFSGAFINYPFRRKRGWYQKNVGICQWFLRRWPVVITNVQLDTGTWFITNSKSSINLQKYYEEVRNPENSKACKKKKVARDNKKPFWAKVRVRSTWKHWPALCGKWSNQEDWKKQNHECLFPLSWMIFKSPPTQKTVKNKKPEVVKGKLSLW